MQFDDIQVGTINWGQSNKLIAQISENNLRLSARVEPRHDSIIKNVVDLIYSYKSFEDGANRIGLAYSLQRRLFFDLYYFYYLWGWWLKYVINLHYQIIIFR